MGKYDGISMRIGKCLVTRKKSSRVFFLDIRLYQSNLLYCFSQHGIPVDTRRTSMEPVSSDLHYCPVTQ